MMSSSSTDANIVNNNMKNRQQPRDGPTATTTFEADPLLIHLTTTTTPNNDNENNNNNNKFFSLVLVTGWPSDLANAIEKPFYQNLCNLTKQCCNEANIINPDDFLYLYPTKFLHITVATLSLLEPFDTNEIDRYEKQKKDYTQMIIQNASKDPDWPKLPLELEFDKIQFGSKAGIILWKEKTGGLQTIRRLVKKYAEETNLSIHAIPNIIHTTFVRYRKQILPDEGGTKLQDLFQSKIVHNNDLNKLKETTIYINSIKLVCERIPYMHIPNDNHHVFLQV